MSDSETRRKIYEQSVPRILSKRAAILSLTKAKATPFYLFDAEALRLQADDYMRAFKKRLPNFSAFYAVKMNNYPDIARHLVQQGFGLDVASRTEIDLAKSVGAHNVLYFAPGKSKDDITYFFEMFPDGTINADSKSEIKKIISVAESLGSPISVGLRVSVASDEWQRYGIPLDQVRESMQQLSGSSSVARIGIHFHTSRNSTAEPYTTAVQKLSAELEGWPADLQKKIAFLDIGGGLEDTHSEGYYESEDNHDITHPDRARVVTLREALSLEEYAREISEAIQNSFFGKNGCSIYAEPGRILCNRAMAIVMRIADIRNTDQVVTDAGVNLVGWQRFMFEYFPAINLSSPSESERHMTVLGNLCTTWDVWGYSVYADQINEGDVLVVPNQGAMTYSLAQNFINPIAPVYELK